MTTDAKPLARRWYIEARVGSNNFRGACVRFIHDRRSDPSLPAGESSYINEPAEEVLASALARAEAAEKERDAVLAGMETVRDHFLSKIAAGEVAPMPICGWCGAPMTDVDAFRAHALVCDKSPPVQRAISAERERDEWQEKAEARQRELNDLEQHALTIKLLFEQRDAAVRERDEARAERDEALKDIRDLLARAYAYDDKPHRLFSAVATMARRWGRQEDVPEIVRLMDYEYEHVWDHHRAASAAASLRERVREVEEALRKFVEAWPAYGDTLSQHIFGIDGRKTLEETSAARGRFVQALWSARALLAPTKATTTPDEQEARHRHEKRDMLAERLLRHGEDDETTPADPAKENDHE